MVPSVDKSKHQMSACRARTKPSVGRWTISLRTLMLVVFVFALIFVAVPGFYWRFFAVPGMHHHTVYWVECHSVSGDSPYRLAGDQIMLLHAWLGRTRPSVFRFSTPALDCKLVLHGDEITRLPISTFHSTQESDGDDPGDIAYLRWKGHIRTGSKSELQQILGEPVSIASWNWQEYDSNFGTRYSDSNGDGKIDTKWQTIDTSQNLLWNDTDGDGFFDTELVHVHGWLNQKASLRTIYIRVPAAD